ncbi:MAG: nodulation protein NfeD [Anaerolineaceae bacterium]|jgi:membrane-bound serine protease (ClpP class)|nr:MAG: nodulation protein NfeD [Anaerolineaceae bacterium]
MKTKRILLFLLVGLTVLQSAFAVSAQNGGPLAIIMTAEGPIMPPMYEYIKRGIQTAERENAEVLVIELNTPGGNVSTMSEIIELIGNSEVPIVIYVSPRDAQAASAGALITMAGDVAAMAPRTVIGAASPVSGSGGDIESTMERKIKEDMKAKVRALVERRGEEATLLAEAMIEDAVAVTANEALDAGLIDFVADDTEDLLQLLHGVTVDVRGETRALNTEDVQTRPLEMSFIEEFLLLLTDPNIAFLLLAIGVQAVLIELSSPGGWFAGFLGAVFLVLAIYGMGVLPINWFGLIFMAIAFVLFILEIKTPTYGALTTAGVASFIIGALVLFNSPGTPQFQRVSVPLVIGMGIFLGALSFIVIMFAIRAQRAPVRIGMESMLGKTGTAIMFQRSAGQVQVGSEQWSAEKSADSEAIRKGDSVEVVEVRGLRLVVRKK